MALCAFLLAASIACGGGGGGDTTPTAPTAPTPVAPASVASVTLSPTSALLGIGSTQQLTATTKDANGNVLSGRTVTWASSDISKATVSSSGLLTAVAIGPVSVTAVSEGKLATADVTVVVPPTATIAKVSVDPTATLTVGALYNGIGGVVVRVTDLSGNPKPNTLVDFKVTSGAGFVAGWKSVVEPRTVITNGSGIAKATFAAGSLAGVNTVTVTAAGATTTSALFSMTATNPGIYTFQDLGQVVGPADVGVPVSTNSYGPSDVTAFELPDGRVRLLYGIAQDVFSPPRDGSSISSDGVHFTVEPGIRAPANSTQKNFPSPFVIPLPGGGYRWFYEGGSGLRSATGADGLNFVEDPGDRVTSPNGTGAHCGGYVKLADGRYRMYCSVTTKTVVNFGAPVYFQSIFTAVSADLLNWNTEPGYLAGPGSANIPGSAAHPTPIVNADGSISIFYYRTTEFPILENSTFYIPVQPFQEWISTSTDGRTFTSETNTGVIGSEAAYLKRKDGSAFIYHGGFDIPQSSTIVVAKITRNAP